MKRKKKAAASRPKPFWILNEKTAPPIVALGAMVVVIVLTLAFNALVGQKNDKSDTANTAKPAELTITTSDNVDLAAEIHYPTGAGPFPLGILVHEFGQDRSQWNSFQEFFIGEGFAVLSYDIRGFGESALSSIPTAQGAWFASMPNDLSAVIKYAKAQAKIDDGKIFVIGAGLGANIAYIGSGTIAEIRKTVLLTPTVNPQLDGNSIDNFFPKSILGIANTSDQEPLNNLMARVTDVASQSIVLDNLSARAVAILADQESRERIINWLNL